MRQAIKDVGKELGPDAVILSNNRVNGGIEVVAAIDFDEELYKKEFSDKDEMNNQPIPASSTQNNQPENKFSTFDGFKPEMINTPSIWSQEPTLIKIQEELHDLRGLLEKQLSGIAWGETGRRYPTRAKLIRHLMELGLGPGLCRDVAMRVPEDLNFKQSWYRALAVLAQDLPVFGDEVLNQKGIITLAGPTGVGKTTTIAKLAARYALRNGRKHVALITTDCFRIGAHEQLRTYGRILDIPVHAVNGEKDLREALNILSDKDLILIDTAGMSQRDIRLQTQLEMIDKVAPQIKTLLVISAATQLAGLNEIVTTFSKNNIHGCILTKLDESSSLGEAITAVSNHRLPVAYLSDGQRVPEDIHIARASTLISRCVSLIQHSDQELLDESLEQVFKGVAVNANV